MYSECYTYVKEIVIEFEAIKSFKLIFKTKICALIKFLNLEIIYEMANCYIIHLNLLVVCRLYKCYKVWQKPESGHSKELGQRCILCR